MKNEEVNYYKPRFKRWIESQKWDSIAERLSDTSMETITQVMNAKKDGDCSWIIWKNCDYVLDRIRSISKEINQLNLNFYLFKDRRNMEVSINKDLSINPNNQEIRV